MMGPLLLGGILTLTLDDSRVPLRPDELTTATMVKAGRARVAAQKQAATRQDDGAGAV